MKTENISGKSGDYFHKLEDGRLQCDLCPRYCKLQDGQRGLCFIRARKGKTIFAPSLPPSLPRIHLTAGHLHLMKSVP